MLALLLRTDEPVIPPPKTVPPKKTEPSHITKTQMGPADALVQKITYNLSAFKKATSEEERKKYAGWISSDLAELGRLKMKKGEREQAMERISQMVSEVEKAPWLVGTKIGALEQIVKGLLDAGPKWKSVREKAENALAGQIRYLSVEEKNTTAEAKVELLVHTEPRVALQPAVFNAINKSYDEQTAYFSLVEKDVWEASIWARDYKPYTVAGWGVGWVQIRYDPPHSELVTEQWARDKKRDNTAWPSGDTVPTEKLPLRMVEMAVHYFEAQAAAARLMGKNTDNQEIRKLADKLESEANSRLKDVHKLGGTPQDRRQALLLLVEYQHNHLEPGLSKMETEKYFADLYKLAGNTFWKKALVWAHEHAQTGMLWTALGMGAINPLAGRMAFIMMGSRDVVKGVENKDWNQTLMGATMLVGLGGLGRVSQVAGGVLVGQVISGAVEQVESGVRTGFTSRDWENLANSAVLLEGFFRARTGEIGRRVKGKLKKMGKPKKTEAKTKTLVQKTEETKAKETAPRTEKEVKKTEETAPKTEKGAPEITTVKEPVTNEKALEQHLQQIYGESKMPPYLNYINMLLGGSASRENFGVLAGKTILDLGCGSRQNPDASLKAGKYEPWLCRSVFETGAKVTGIDNMPQIGERFPSLQADLSKPGVLDAFADNSVDLINANALLSNYRYEYPSTNIGPSLIRQLNRPSNNFRDGQANYNKMEDEIFSQAGRILKEGGWFVLNGGSTLYQKKNGQLVMQRQGDMPGGFDAWFKDWANMKGGAAYAPESPPYIKFTDLGGLNINLELMQKLAGKKSEVQKPVEKKTEEPAAAIGINETLSLVRDAMRSSPNAEVRGMADKGAWADTEGYLRQMENVWDRKTVENYANRIRNGAPVDEVLTSCDKLAAEFKNKPRPQEPKTAEKGPESKTNELGLKVEEIRQQRLHDLKNAASNAAADPIETVFKTVEKMRESQPDLAASGEVEGILQMLGQYRERANDFKAKTAQVYENYAKYGKLTFAQAIEQYDGLVREAKDIQATIDPFIMAFYEFGNANNVFVIKDGLKPYVQSRQDPGRIDRLFERSQSMQMMDGTKAYEPQLKEVDAAAITFDLMEEFSRRYPFAGKFSLNGQSVYSESFAMPKPQVKVFIDPNLYETVLTNLLQNAKIYAKSSIDVEVEYGSDGVTVKVRDNGPGIPAGVDATKLFEGQVDPNRVGSTGTGLPAARKFARQMGGDVYLSKTGPDGTEFVIKLPYAEGPASAGHKDAQAPVPADREYELEAIEMGYRPGAGRGITPGKTGRPRKEKQKGKAGAQPEVVTQKEPAKSPGPEQAARILFLPDTNYFITLISQGQPIEQVLDQLQKRGDVVLTRPVYDELVRMSHEAWHRGPDGRPLVSGRDIELLNRAAADGRLSVYEVDVGAQDMRTLSDRLQELSGKGNRRLSRADASIVLAARELGGLYPNMSPMSLDDDVQVLMMDWKKSRARQPVTAGKLYSFPGGFIDAFLDTYKDMRDSKSPRGGVVDVTVGKDGVHYRNIPGSRVQGVAPLYGIDGQKTYYLPSGFATMGGDGMWYYHNKNRVGKNANKPVIAMVLKEGGFEPELVRPGESLRLTDHTHLQFDESPKHTFAFAYGGFEVMPMTGGPVDWLGEAGKPNACTFRSSTTGLLFLAAFGPGWRVFRNGQEVRAQRNLVELKEGDRVFFDPSLANGYQLVGGRMKHIKRTAKANAGNAPPPETFRPADLRGVELDPYAILRTVDLRINENSTRRQLKSALAKWSKRHLKTMNRPGSAEHEQWIRINNAIAERKAAEDKAKKYRP